MIGVVALGLLGAGALALADFDRTPQLGPRPAAQRPGLLLLTSLPLVFPEEFSLDGGGSPALKALETRYSVRPIATTDRASLARSRLLLMAHPLAQPAENLVALDAWVRAGGRVLLLADPKLEWPSSRPLGDKLRPPPSFADTGLLAHWGLKLEGPDKAGRAARKITGRPVATLSPGNLSGSCRVSRDRLVAHCRPGKGEATVIADVDFLNIERLGEDGRSNLEALLAELDALER